MKTTQYIVLAHNQAIRFLDLPGRTAFEIVSEAEATRFDSMTQAHLAAISHGIKSHEVRLVWGEE